MKSNPLKQFSVWCIAIFLSGATALAWWIGSFGLQIALATFILIVTLLLTLMMNCRRSTEQPWADPLRTLLDLAKEPELGSIHNRIANSLIKVATKNDPIYRRLAFPSLERLADDCDKISFGTIEYRSTETWRVVYEELLRSPGLHLYRSVAHIETAHYWQDGPGRQSTLLNLQLHDAGIVNIERIVIIADHLWSVGQLPIEPVQSWLHEQHCHGIWLRLVRESELAGETDLVSDFGIYGIRAVGTQMSDVTGRTTRFVLCFGIDRVEQAEQTWKRLEVFSTPYREVLDRES